jgi:uracil-DNA glycosylase
MSTIYENTKKDNLTNLTDLTNLTNLTNQTNQMVDQILSDVQILNNCSETHIINLLYSHNIHSSWYELFLSNHQRLSETIKLIDSQRETKTIYPSQNLVFKCFESDIADIKIVLLGQDPYINKDQAMGLSFSVPKTTPIPPSLYNIFKEIKAEYPERKYEFTHGDLTKWSTNGVFLLNSALTVIEKKSNSQQSLWSWFTDLTIEYINSKSSNVVFLLLGRNAIDKHVFVDKTKNKIACASHPSPLSAHTGFFGSEIFKKVEQKLGSDFDWSN